MALENLPSTLKKIKEAADLLLGEQATHALLVVSAVAIALLTASSAFPEARQFADVGLLLCGFFGLTISAFGVFTHQVVKGLALQKGFVIGALAGAFAALTAGAAYYAFNQAACCLPLWEAKLLRLLTGSVPMGGLLGALMGWLRPTGPAPDGARSEGSPSSDFLGFILGSFLLLVLCVVYLIAFDRMRTFIGDSDGPQGLIRFWHIALILGVFAVSYVALIVNLYGRADDAGTAPERRTKAASSSIAALIAALTLFGAASFLVGNTDFQPRRQATVCTAPALPCPECMAGEVCAGDPTQANFIAAILVRTIILVLLLLITYVAATHPRSPLLKLVELAGQKGRDG